MRNVIEIDRALRAAQVDTVSLREGVVTSTPRGDFFNAIMASFTEFEGRVIYGRLSKSKRKKSSEGGYTGGWLAYGYRRTDHGTIAVVLEEAAVVERFFCWLAEGKSLSFIAKALRGENAPTRNGCAWRPSTIRGTLGNRFYTGRVEFDGDLIRNQHDAVVSGVHFKQSRAHGPTDHAGAINPASPTSRLRVSE